MIIKTKKFDRWARKTALTDASAKELEALQLLAGDLLSLKKEQIRRAINDGTFLEVIDEKTK